MNNNEILEWVQILKFDYKKHDSLQKALKELLQNENYMLVVKGHSTDVKYLREVQEIYEAFKKLKEIDLEEIVSMIKETESGQEILDSDELKEVIAFNDGVIHLLEKNDEEEYQEIARLEEKTYLIEDFSYFVKKETSKIHLYNFRGEKIFSFDNLVGCYIKIVCNGIVRYSYGNKVLYVDYNGDVLLDDCSSLYEENVDKLLKTQKFTYRQAKSLLLKNKRYTFLNTFLVDEIYERFIRLTGNRGVMICDYEGRVIVDTINYNYCNIGKIPKNSEAEIVEVAVFDKALNKTYGYFDLASEKEIVSPKHLYVLPWVVNGVLIDYECPTYVIKNEKEIDFWKVDKEKFMRVEENYKKVLTERCDMRFRNNAKKFLEYLLKENSQNYPCSDFFLDIQSKKKIDENTYLFSTQSGNVYWAFKQKDLKFGYKLIGENCMYDFSLFDKCPNILIFVDNISGGEFNYMQSLFAYRIDRGNKFKGN